MDNSIPSTPVRISESPFERIKRSDNNGQEYWSARELLLIFDYTEYRNFKPVIAKAIEACKNSGIARYGRNR